MRRHLLTTAAAIAMASPAFAADLSLSGGYPTDNVVYNSAPMARAKVWGDLELSLGWVHSKIEDCNNCEKSVANFSGWGRANVPVGTWNVLVETGGSAVFGGDLNGSSKSSISAFGHVWGGSNAFRYGAFGGATFGLFGLTWGSAGLEAGADFGNVTVGAQGFYSWASPDCGGCGINPDVYGVRGWLDYYFTPDTKLTARLEWSKIDDICGPGCSADNLGASARVTHRFTGTAFNIFGEGGYWNTDFKSGGPTFDTFAIRGGFTINLDGQGISQKEHDDQVPFTFRGPLSASLLF